MSSLRNLIALGATIVLSTAAFATVESSCPAPCAVPPRSALFVRDNGGNLPPNGTSMLSGTLLKGIRKTVARVDATMTALVIGTGVNKIQVSVTVNGVSASILGLAQNVCDPNSSEYCTVIGSFWFDIDALEAANPGQFIGQPLDVSFDGHPVGVSPALLYTSSFSAEVVKKK